ncbi:unnamed protein product [Heterosigma akashiwo]
MWDHQEQQCISGHSPTRSAVEMLPQLVSQVEEEAVQLLLRWYANFTHCWAEVAVCPLSSTKSGEIREVATASRHALRMLALPSCGAAPIRRPWRMVSTSWLSARRAARPSWTTPVRRRTARPPTSAEPPRHQPGRVENASQRPARTIAELSCANSFRRRRPRAPRCVEPPRPRPRRTEGPSSRSPACMAAEPSWAATAHRRKARAMLCHQPGS